MRIYGFTSYQGKTKEFKEVRKEYVLQDLCSFKAHVENEKVVARSTDFDVYVESKLELLNVDNILTEAVVIPTDIVMKLVKAVPVNTIIYKSEEDGNFYMRLYGGDIVLETYTMGVDKFMFQDDVEQKARVSANDLYSVMKDFTPVVTAACFSS